MHVNGNQELSERLSLGIFQSGFMKQKLNVLPELDMPKESTLSFGYLK
jgi:hypothetical protein